MGAERFRAGYGALVLFAACISSRAATFANTIRVTPAKDNTLVESRDGGLSSGADPGLFAGVTFATEGSKRRALLQFDLADSIPANSQVVSVTLSMHVNKTKAPLQAMTLYRVLADWGESGSIGGGVGGGRGGPAQVGDATWLHTSFATAFWATPGGDFVPAASAQTSVGGVGTYIWGTTPEMVADVQSWVDAPATNFGWVLLGDEGSIPSAKRFVSREGAASVRPALTIDFTPGSPVEAQTWSRVKALYRR